MKAGRRRSALNMNNGESLRLVWVYRRVDGVLFSEEPMIHLREEAQTPTVIAAASDVSLGCLILFPLDAVGCEVLAARDFRVVRVDASDPEWPLPKLPSVEVEIKPYGGTRGETTYKKEIGALPAGHLRCQVWMSPRVSKECSRELIDVYAQLTESAFRLPRDGGVSIADILERPPLSLTPVDIVREDDAVITFQVPARCMGMVLGVFHAHDILARPGNPMHEAELEAMSDDRLRASVGDDAHDDRDCLSEKALDQEYDALKSRHSGVMIADNVIRNYAGWQQDMSGDPRMGRPRRDEVNWYLDMLPDAIKRMVDEDGRLAYTMEALASLIFEYSSRAQPGERRLIDNLVGSRVERGDDERSQQTGTGYGVSPMKQYILAEKDIDEGRSRKRARDTDEGLYGKQGSLTKVLLLGPTQHVDRDDDDKTEMDRLLLGDYTSRMLVNEASDGLREVQRSPPPSSFAVQKWRIPEVHHLTECQQRQLIECLYSRVVYHMHPNTLRIAKATSWIYFLHGKIGRFIGPYKTPHPT